MNLVEATELSADPAAFMTRPRPGNRSEHDDAVNLGRRGFLSGSAALLAAGGMVGCTTDDVGQRAESGSTSTSAPSRARAHFNPHEAATVEAISARIIPGTPEDPGAREAEVVVYIDGLLSIGGGYGEPVYRSGPFVTIDDAEPGSDQEDAEDADFEVSSYGVIDRPSGVFSRYGDQSMLTPADVYRAGLPLLDEHCRNRFGAPFVDLTDEQQDGALTALDDGEATEFDDGEPTAQDLFELVRRHTIEGMFADPMYGGNRNKVGWHLIGWPAAQRAYTPEELVHVDLVPREPKSIDELHGFNAGHRDRVEPELPVAGADAGVGGHQGHEGGGFPGRSEEP